MNSFSLDWTYGLHHLAVHVEVDEDDRLNFISESEIS